MALIILDRDGVINEDSDLYIKSPDEWHPIPGSLAAIAKLTDAGNAIAIATNQSGVGRGLYSLATLAAIHHKMQTAIEAEGGRVTLICFCPHTPDDLCDCRKPKPGLFLQISDLLKVDLTEAIMVGDHLRDLTPAESVGCAPILVKTGKGAGQVASGKVPAHIPVYDDLASWVDAYLGQVVSNSRDL
jgi:D-glycero-D-manno-heptose 1,7-bisphosphate phosphatase